MSERRLVMNQWPDRFLGTLNAEPIWGHPALSLLLESFICPGAESGFDATGKACPLYDIRFRVMKARPLHAITHDAADWSDLAAAIPSEAP